MKKPKKIKPKQKVIKKYAAVDGYDSVYSEFFPDLQSCKDWIRDNIDDISGDEVYIYEFVLLRKYQKSNTPTYIEVSVE